MNKLLLSIIFVGFIGSNLSHLNAMQQPSRMQNLRESVRNGLVALRQRVPKINRTTLTAALFVGTAVVAAEAIDIERDYLLIESAITHINYCRKEQQLLEAVGVYPKTNYQGPTVASVMRRLAQMLCPRAIGA